MSGGCVGAAPRPRAGAAVAAPRCGAVPSAGAAGGAAAAGGVLAAAALGVVVPAPAPAPVPRAAGGFGMPSSATVALIVKAVPTVAASGVALRKTVGGLL